MSENKNRILTAILLFVFIGGFQLPLSSSTLTGTLTLGKPNVQIFGYRKDNLSYPFTYRNGISVSEVLGFTTSFTSSWTPAVGWYFAPDPPYVFRQLIRIAPEPTQFSVMCIEPRNTGFWTSTTRDNGFQDGSSDNNYVIQYGNPSYDPLVCDGSNTSVINEYYLYATQSTMPSGIYGWYWSTLCRCSSTNAISNEIVSWGRSMRFSLDSATATESTHKIDYLYSTSTTGYNPTAQSAYYRLFDRNFKEVSWGSLNNPPSTRSLLSLTYSVPGPYYLIIEALSNYKTDNIPYYECTSPDNPNYLYAAVKRQLHYAEWIQNAGPRFEITEVSPSVLEPVYEDKLTIKWRKTYHEFYAQSILVLDSTGAQKASTDITNKIENTNWNVVSDPWRWSGEITSFTLPEDLAPGRYQLAVKYSDGYIQKLEKYFNVAVSIYNVYTAESATLYVGDATQGKTSFHYSLSGAVQSVSIGVGGVKTITKSDSGNVSKDDHVWVDAWDGKDINNEYVDGGPYTLDVNITPLTGQPKGEIISISEPEHSPSFTPGNGNSLPISFVLTEPVKRPQATTAYLTVAIYEENGEIVRLLLNNSSILQDNSPVKIDNGTTGSVGCTLAVSCQSYTKIDIKRECKASHFEAGDQLF